MSVDSIKSDPDALARSPEKAYLLVGRSAEIRAAAEAEARKSVAQVHAFMSAHRPRYSKYIGDRTDAQNVALTDLARNFEIEIAEAGEQAVQAYTERRIRGEANDEVLHWSTRGCRVYVHADTLVYGDRSDIAPTLITDRLPNARVEGDILCIEYPHSSFDNEVRSLGNKDERGKYQPFFNPSKAFDWVGLMKLPQKMETEKGRSLAFVPLCKAVRVEGYPPSAEDKLPQPHGYLWQNPGYTWEGSLRGDPSIVCNYGFEDVRVKRGIMTDVL